MDTALRPVPNRRANLVLKITVMIFSSVGANRVADAAVLETWLLNPGIFGHASIQGGPHGVAG